MDTMANHVAALTALVLLNGIAPIPAVEAQTPAGTPTVAVMYFNNSSLISHAEYEPLRAGLADVLITELQSNPRIVVVERDALQKILEEQNLVKEERVDAATGVRLGKLLGAQHMILGGFLIDRAGKMRVDARAVNVETSRVEYVETATGNADDVFEILSSLARKINDGLKLPARPRAAPPPARPSGDGGRAKVTPFQAVQTFARAVTEENNKNKEGAVTLYRKFLAETPVSVATAQRAKAEARIKVLSGGG